MKDERWQIFGDLVPHTYNNMPESVRHMMVGWLRFVNIYATVDRHQFYIDALIC